MAVLNVATDPPADYHRKLDRQLIPSKHYERYLELIRGDVRAPSPDRSAGGEASGFGGRYFDAGRFRDALKWHRLDCWHQQRANARHLGASTTQKHIEDETSAWGEVAKCCERLSKEESDHEIEWLQQEAVSYLYLSKILDENAKHPEEVPVRRRLGRVRDPKPQP